MFNSHHLGWPLTHTADFFECGEEHGFFHLKMPFHFVQERGWNFRVIEHTPNQVEVRIWQESR